MSDNRKITNKRTMLADSWDDNKTKWYKIGCSCCDDEHTLSIWVEANPNFDEVGIKLYTKATTDYWTNPIKITYKESDIVRWFKEKYNSLHIRVREAFKILFKGYFETESSLLIHDKETLQNLINILEEGKENCFGEEKES